MHTRFALAGITLLMLGFIPAVGQEKLDGLWDIKEGRYDKSTYEGTVEIKSGLRIYKLYWNTAGKEFWGFGTEENGKVYAAWSRAESFGYVLYTIYSDSSLSGTWGLSSAPEDHGREHLTGGSISAKNTQWLVRGSNPSGGSAYQGTMQMERDGDVYHIVWNVGTDTYYGIGYRVDDKLVVGWGGATDEFGAVVYSIFNNGLRGKWVAHNGNAVGIENIARSRD